MLCDEDAVAVTVKGFLVTKREKIAIAATGVYMGIMVVGMYVMKHVYHIDYGKPEMVTVLVYFMPFSAGSALLFYHRFFRGMAFNRIKLNPWIIWYMGVATVAVVLQVFLGKFVGGNMNLVWTIVVCTLMVGIGEEMLFRGIIFNAFKETRGVYPAVLLSATIFGFLHVTNLLGGAQIGSTLMQMVSAGVSGIVEAWIFYKTNNVLPTILYHWMWDGLLLIGMVVPVQQVTWILTAKT